MRFFTTFASMAIAAFAAVASAQMRNNAFTSPVAGTVIEAGETYNIEWMNLRGERVTIVVMSGPDNQLEEVITIADNIPNDGSFEWTAPDDLPSNGAYALRISYDNNPANWNYSDRFVFTSSVTATPTSRTSRPASTSASESSASSESTTETESESESQTTSATSATSSAISRAATTTNQSSMSTSSRSGTSGAPSSTQTGAPQSGASTLSSPLAVMVAVLAAALFLH